MSSETDSHPFTLPRGYLNHRDGTMRLAKALDEIEILQDPRVQANEGCLSLVLLSRVITQLGDLGDDEITPDVIGDLYVSDLSYLEDFYQRINSAEPYMIGIICPKCNKKIEVQVAPLDI